MGVARQLAACWQPLAITVVLTGNMSVSGIDIICDVGFEIIVSVNIIRCYLNSRLKSSFYISLQLKVHFLMLKCLMTDQSTAFFFKL